MKTGTSILIKASLIAVSAFACGSDGDMLQIPDPDCDALLTPADFMSVCGTEVTLTPSGFEGIELNPCNRAATNNEGVLLVTRHPSSEVADQAAVVAGGRGPTAQSGLGLNASAGSKSIFTVEVKATDDPAAVCAPDELPQLLDIALSRIDP